MNKQRKKIGVITTDPENIYQGQMLDGIFKKAAELNCDVLVFTTFVKANHINFQYLEGEANIYNIINFDLLDGVILLTQTFKYQSDNLIYDQVKNLLRKKCHCPVISVDESMDSYEQINTDDTKAFEKLTDHVIEVHKCRKIYLLAGEENTSASLMRVCGFKNSLKKHGFEINEDDIMYGEFWYSFGERTAAKIASGELEKPDAVIAASDYIGLGFMSEAVKLGMKIPDDFIVTGYDCVIESRANDISLTSYIPPISDTGAEAVVRILKHIDSGTPDFHFCSAGRMVYGMSCGCRVTNNGKRERDDFGYIVPYTRPEIDMKKFLGSYMTERLTESSTIDECMDQIMKHGYLVDNGIEYYLCTCQGWDDSSESCYGNKAGYTTTVNISVYRCVPEIFDEWEKECSDFDPYVNTSFSSSLMLPKIFETKRDVPAVFYFTPVHFNGRRTGYSVMRFKPENAVVNFIYQQWSRNVNNALEMMRVRKLLLAKSTRDTMTGLYNRNSLDGHIREQFENSVKHGTELFFEYVDMNSLKHINDVYGHSAGDNAINVLAGVISSVCIENCVCVRIGGDEFLIVGHSSDAHSDLENKNAEIISRLDSYNKTSGKPYRVTASFGASIRKITDISETDEMIKEADARMYEYKVEFKKNNKT